jgi:hypothetical protein
VTKQGAPIAAVGSMSAEEAAEKAAAVAAERARYEALKREFQVRRGGGWRESCLLAWPPSRGSLLVAGMMWWLMPACSLNHCDRFF